MDILAEGHKTLMLAFKHSPVTVEDIARAMASIDGKRDEFDAGKNLPVSEDATGHYAGYLAEAEEVLRRAVGYVESRYGRKHLDRDRRTDK